jgi:DNA adenine methylase
MILKRLSVYEKPRKKLGVTYWYWFASWRLPGKRSPVERYLGPSQQGDKISKDQAMARAVALKSRDLKKIQKPPVPRPFLRYPGGKTRMKSHIIKYLNQFESDKYAEPFCGGLGIGLHVIPRKDESWVNDMDFNIYAMWHSVIYKPKELIELAGNFTPSVEAFKEFKIRLSNHKSEDLVQVGFMKMALHQMSYSGLGERAGSPIGGFLQKKKNSEEASKYLVDSRWNFPRIKNQINICHAILKNTKCTCMDFEAVIKQASGYAIYCDPPYYEKGNELYAHRFSEDDHRRLAETLKHRENWVLSYDDTAKIREIYDFAAIEEVDVRYSIKNSMQQKKELIIHI